MNKTQNPRILRVCFYFFPGAHPTTAEKKRRPPRRGRNGPILRYVNCVGSESIAEETGESGVKYGSRLRIRFASESILDFSTRRRPAGLGRGDTQGEPNPAAAAVRALYNIVLFFCRIRRFSVGDALRKRLARPIFPYQIQDRRIVIMIKYINRAAGSPGRRAPRRRPQSPLFCRRRTVRT